jgi:hypothetical protein
LILSLRVGTLVLGAMFARNTRERIAANSPFLDKLLVALFQIFVDTPVNGRPSLFRIDSAHQIETSLSHALWVY